MTRDPMHLSRLGLGLAALGRPGYINLGHGQDLGQAPDVPTLEARCHAVLDAAWTGGVRYFDAARSYGRAEAFLAGWLHARDIKPDELTVGSKWGYTYTADWQVQADQHEVKDHSEANFLRQWPQTQALLGPWLKLYLIHSATLDSGALDSPPLLARLAELAASGLRVGLSLSGAGQAETLQRALGVQMDNVNPFSVVQASWNLLEPSCGHALAQAVGAGWTVVVKEALANGRLGPRGAEAKHPAMLNVCARYGLPPDVIALAAALAQPWASCVLSGAASVEQVESNLRAAPLRLSPTDLAELGTLALPAQRYWQERSELAWN